MMKENVSIISGGAEEQAIAKGGVAIPFPWRLHEMLKVTAEEGIQDIVPWAPHGRAFIVHKPRDFAGKVLTRYVRPPLMSECRTWILDTRRGSRKDLAICSYYTFTNRLGNIIDISHLFIFLF